MYANHTTAAIHFDSTIFIVLIDRFEACRIIDWLNRFNVGLTRLFSIGSSTSSLAVHTHTMSLPPDTDDTNQQPIDHSMQDMSATTVDTSVAAAAVDLHLPSESSSSSQSHVSKREHHLTPLQLALIDAPVYALHWCTCVPLVPVCPVQPVDSAGKPKCALCPTRLSNCKGKLHQHKIGRICQRCYNGTIRQPHADPRSSTPARLHKRTAKRKRAVSDPGQPQNLSRLRTGAPPPTTIPPIKKTRVKADPVDFSSLLDQAHARRMALIEEEQTDAGMVTAGAAVLNTSSIPWQ